jgi:ABC-2 type transport system ATP-binding protein
VTAAVTTHSVSCSYGAGVDAVADVSFSVPVSAVVGLFGPIGAGKTTLLECCAGLRGTTRGTIDIGGVRVVGRNLIASGIVAFSSVETEMPSGATLDDIMRWLKPLSSRWDHTLARDLVSEFALPERKAVRRLSRGQRGLVSLVCAMSTRPDVLLLDEPMTALDVRTREALVRRILALVCDHGTTVVVATHDVVEFDGAVSHLAVLDRGRLAVSSSLEELQARFRRFELTGDPEMLRKVQHLVRWHEVAQVGRHMTGVAELTNGLEPLCTQVEMVPAIDAITVEDLSLRDFYMTFVRPVRTHNVEDAR